MPDLDLIIQAEQGYAGGSPKPILSTSSGPKNTEPKLVFATDLVQEQQTGG
jgi:hypothetical protein